MAIVVDAEGDYEDPICGFTCMSLRRMVPPDWFREASFYYDAVELCCAARPFVSEYIYKTGDHLKWIYMDADIYVLAPLEGVFDESETASVLVAPHRSVRDGFTYEANHAGLRYGSYNAGMMAFRRTDETRQFLGWFKQCLWDGCFDDWHGEYLDQRWIEQGISLFRGVCAISDPGVNVGYWNVEERAPYRSAAGWVCHGGYPLRAIHFSHWPIAKRDVVPAQWAGGAAEVSTIARQYFEAIERYSRPEDELLGYRFGVFSDGGLVRRSTRRGYFLSAAYGDRQGAPFRVGWRRQLWSLAYKLSESQQKLRQLKRLWLR